MTAPLWLLFILTGILIAVQARFVQPDYFPQGKSLFPQWPVVDPVRAMWMFVGTMGLLLVPKLLGCIAVLLHRPRTARLAAARCGCWLGMLLETIIAGLMAPVVMLTQTIDVAAILRRTRFRMERATARWTARFRHGRRVRLYRRHTVLGLLLGGVAWAGLAVPGAVDAAGRARACAGDPSGAGDRAALRRAGLLRTPERRDAARAWCHAPRRCSASGRRERRRRRASAA